MPPTLTTTPDMETGVAGFLIWFGLVALFGLSVAVVNRRATIRARREARRVLSSPRVPEVT